MPENHSSEKPATKHSLILTSSVAKKYIMAITGVALFGFLVTHLSGNLLTLCSDGEMFNAYAKKLKDFGVLLWVAEAGLAAFFLIHAFQGIQLFFQNRAARPEKYAATGSVRGKTKGGPSKSNISSQFMAVSGTVVLIFLIYHIWHFKFGPDESAGYVTTVHGDTARDLYLLVREEFHKFPMVVVYVIPLILLGIHLRHGFWSLFQSLGVTHSKAHKIIYSLAFWIALLMSIGFIIIPLWIYFGDYFKAGNV